MQALGASIVGISVDPVDKTRSMAKKLAISFPLLHDEGLAVARAWNVANEGNGIAEPAVFVIDQQRTITWKYLGESPPDRPPAADIIAAVEALHKR